MAREGSPVCGGGATPPQVTRPATGWGRTAERVERFFHRHRAALTYVHVFMFVVFVAIIVVPVFMPEPAEDATPWTDYTRFANYALWGLWFPLVFLSVIVTGRSWCGLMCPMGAASEWANNRGLQRAIPRWLSWEGTPIVSFLLVTVLGQTVGVRDHPEAALEVFGGTMVLAIIIGFLYGRKKRAWCRHMCPIGLLLGVFSRLGAVQFTPKRKAGGGDRWTEKGPCPTMIDVARKEESRHCIECFRCVNPDARGSVALRLRAPGEEIEKIRTHHPNGAEIWFFFLGTGIALGGFLWLVLPQYTEMRQALAEWFINREMYWIGEPGPWWLMSVHPERREVFRWLDFFTISAFMTAVMVAFTLVLGATTGAATAIAGRFGATGAFKRRFIELGYQYAPIALVSLIIGLGTELFSVLGFVGLDGTAVGYAKGLFFAAALVWSVWLGNRILESQSVTGTGRMAAALPGIAGSLFVGLAWYPAIFGL